MSDLEARAKAYADSLIVNGDKLRWQRVHDGDDVKHLIRLAYIAAARETARADAEIVKSQPDVEVWNSGVIQATPTRIHGAISREKTTGAILAAAGIERSET